VCTSLDSPTVTRKLSVCFIAFSCIASLANNSNGLFLKEKLFAGVAMGISENGIYRNSWI
jgi:hypothetical protein